MMKQYKEPTWHHEVTGFDGDTTLFGINIFSVPWEDMHQKVKVKDPLYQKEHWVWIYRAEIGGKIHEFAAGEIRNSVWAFYTYRY